jgi:hypothetical protein
MRADVCTAIARALAGHRRPVDPWLCRTCQAARSVDGGYCSARCRVFDAALTAHAERIGAVAAGLADPRSLIVTRSILRAVADVYDAVPDAERARSVAIDVAEGYVDVAVYVEAIRGARVDMAE